MNIDTLEGAELDAAVAAAEAHTYRIDMTGDEPVCFASHLNLEGSPFKPSSFWHQGGPIIQREFIMICRDHHSNTKWFADCGGYMEHDYLVSGPTATGATPLIAAMRAFLKSKEKP